MVKRICFKCYAEFDRKSSYINTSIKNLIVALKVMKQTKINKKR